MGKATSKTDEGKCAALVVLSYGGICVIVAMKWLMEKPAQQLHVQKGEQSSCCVSPFWVFDFANSVFALLSFAATPISAQGITLSAKTRKAIMKARIFTGCKGNLSILLMTRQKLTPCCRSKKSPKA